MNHDIITAIDEYIASICHQTIVATDQVIDRLLELRSLATAEDVVDVELGLLVAAEVEPSA